MADERTCFAGDLSSDALGKTIRFQLNTPTKDVRELVVVEVVHRKRESIGKRTLIKGVAKGEPVSYVFEEDFTVEVLA